MKEDDLEGILEALEPEGPVAVLMIRANPDVPHAYRTHWWAHRISKRTAALLLARMSADWRREADANDDRAGLN